MFPFAGPLREGRFSGQRAEKWDVFFPLASKRLLLVSFLDLHIKADLRDLKNCLTVQRCAVTGPRVSRFLPGKFSFRRARERMIGDDVTCTRELCHRSVSLSTILLYRGERSRKKNVHEHTKHTSTISLGRPARIRRNGPSKRDV